jgi:hypothetical protein
MTSNGPVNPPASINFAITIFALISAALLIMGFISHYMPPNNMQIFAISFMISTLLSQIMTLCGLLTFLIKNASCKQDN